MNSVHIAEKLETLRRARLHAQTTGNEADWARVHNMQRELNEQAEGYLWSLLGEIGDMKKVAKAKEAARILKGGQTW